MSRTLLILRPEPGASATATRAAAMGIDVAVLPLFETRPIEWAALDPARFDALLMTSASAATLSGPKLDRFLHLPLYAVGQATAQAAQGAGFTDIVTGSGDITAISRKMISDERKNVLHFAGRDKTRFQQNPPKIVAVTTYASHMLPPPTIPTNAVALLHSTRAAHRFSELAKNKSSIAIVAISNAVADAAGRGWQSVTIADRPQDVAMLALAARLCETREA